MVQTIVLTGDKPILATAAIGSSGILETVKVVLGVAGQGLDLATVQAAPPPLYNFMLAQPSQSVLSRGLAIPDGAYPADFVKNLRRHLPRHPRFPGLIVEITEHEAVSDPEFAREVAVQLKLYNVHVSIDDFGAGYSTFARLKELPFAELKLDRSYVNGDSCFGGRVELAYDFARPAPGDTVPKRTQAFVGIDHGKVWTNAFSRSDRWSSASIGVRALHGRFLGEVSLTRILALPSGTTPQRKTRLWFQTAMRF